MRSKFVLRITAASVSAFPTNEALGERFLMLGFGDPNPQNVAYEIRQKEYQDEAVKEWAALPELAAAEKERVIFFSRLPDHGRLLVTRVSQGSATVRFIHDNLGRLEKNTEDAIRELSRKNGSIEALEVQDNKVEIYEKGANHVLIIGRVIRNTFQETIRRNPADLVTSLVTGVATIVTFFLLTDVGLTPNSVFQGTVQRFSTAMLSAFFISVVNFVQHWARLKREGIIEWKPAVERA
jgi:hypothetical protein